MMSGLLTTRFRIFPSLIAVAGVALVLKSVSVASGVNLLIAEANAQDQITELSAGDNQTIAAVQDAEPEADTSAGDQALADLMQDGDLSREELDMLQKLRDRREVLKGREMQLDLREQMLASTEKRINDKIIKLSELEVRLNDLLRLYDDNEEKQLLSIAKVYETMKAKDAAPRFEMLDIQIQLDLASLMKESKLAALMAKMNLNKVEALTTEMAIKKRPPTADQVIPDNQG